MIGGLLMREIVKNHYIKIKYRFLKLFPINSKKKTVYFSVFAISLIVLILLIISLVRHLVPSSKTDFSEYHNNNVKIDVDNTSDDPIDPYVNFDELKKSNWDVCGWIQIPDTTINYPILQSDDQTDDSFYLNHGFDKKELFDGSIFISKENDNDFLDRNTVIYGHNLKNNQMFTPLLKFKNKEFFNDNQFIYIHKPRQILIFRIFAAVVFDDRNIMSSYDFSDNNSVSSFLNDLELFANNKSGQFQNDFQLAGENQLITLSTCTNKTGERFIVVAAKVGEQTTTK